MERAIMTKTKAKKQNDLVNDGDKVWVTITETVSIGNYETVRIEAGYSQTIKDRDEPMDLIDKMEERLEDYVLERGASIKEEFTDKIVKHRK